MNQVRNGDRVFVCKEYLNGDRAPGTVIPSYLRGRKRIMRAFYLKNLSFLLVIIFSAIISSSFVFAADQPAAMLYSHGTALLNGDSIARSSAIFSGDLVQTSADSVANINAAGSSVLVLNDSLVQYQGSALKLEHGGVTISTSKSLATQAGGVTVSPVAGVSTEFEVRDVDGRVMIAARKGDLTVSDGTGTTTLSQGQETTRDDSQQTDEQKKKKNRRVAAAVVPAWGGALDSPWAVGIAGGIVIGGTAWVLLQNENPASPSQ